MQFYMHRWIPLQIPLQMNVHRTRFVSHPVTVHNQNAHKTSYPGSSKGRRQMTRTAGTRRATCHRTAILPGVTAPPGGGLIKIGQASTRAAVSVGLAPYAVMT